MSTIDYKFIEHFCRDTFTRAFARRFSYLYFGIDDCADDVFVLSDTEDTDFKYCEPMQATGLVRVQNADHLAMLTSWFQSYGIDRQTPYLFDLKQVCATLNKTAWDSADIAIHQEPSGAVKLQVGSEEAVQVARPILTHFTLTLLQKAVLAYHRVFFSHAIASHVVVPADLEKLNRLTTCPVAAADLVAAGLLDCPCRDLNLILIPGLDVLTIKALLKKDRPYESGVRIWAENGTRCLNYGGFYHDADRSLCVSRDNIFIFPKPNPGAVPQ